MFISEFKGSDEKKAEIFGDALLDGKVIKAFVLRENFRISVKDEFKKQKDLLFKVLKELKIFSLR